jgi:hypothetical protein
MDENKVRFLHWINFYSNIYELPSKERPKKEIIQNDTLLDEWVRLYNAKQKRTVNPKRAQKQHDDVITFG